MNVKGSTVINSAQLVFFTSNHPLIEVMSSTSQSGAVSTPLSVDYEAIQRRLTCILRGTNVQFRDTLRFECEVEYQGNPQFDEQEVQFTFNGANPELCSFFQKVARWAPQ